MGEAGPPRAWQGRLVRGRATSCVMVRPRARTKGTATRARARYRTRARARARATARVRACAGLPSPWLAHPQSAAGRSGPRRRVRQGCGRVMQGHGRVRAGMW